jgi:hypothetical protein
MAEQTDALTSSYALRKCKLHISAVLHAGGNGRLAGDGRRLKVRIATHRLAGDIGGGCGQTLGARGCRVQLEILDVRIANGVAQALIMPILAHLVRVANGGSAVT